MNFMKKNSLCVVAALFGLAHASVAVAEGAQQLVALGYHPFCKTQLKYVYTTKCRLVFFLAFLREMRTNALVK